MSNAVPPGRSRRTEEASAALRREIEHGRFREALHLPGERQLAELLHVSRTTLRRALAGLVGEDLLVQRQGMGTFITRHRAHTELPRQCLPYPADGFELGAAVTGWRELGREVFRPTAEEAMMLSVPPTETVLRLSRIALIDEVPAALEHAAVPSRFLPDTSFPGTVVMAALAARGILPVRTMHRLRISPLGNSDADRLGLPPQGLAVSVHSLFLLADGRCCAFTRSLVRPDRFDAVFETRSSVRSRERA